MSKTKAREGFKFAFVADYGWSEDNIDEEYDYLEDAIKRGEKCWQSDPSYLYMIYERRLIKRWDLKHAQSGEIVMDGFDVGSEK